MTLGFEVHTTPIEQNRKLKKLIKSITIILKKQNRNNPKGKHQMHNLTC
jgi:hypothetical protein